MKQKRQNKKRQCLSRGCSAFKALVIRQKRLLGIGLIIAAALFWFCLPSELFDTPYSTVILDRNGELIGASIAADEQWRFPPRAEVPEKFIRAITLYEDRHFFHHPGVDLLAIGRAVRGNLHSGRIVSGASTLTMQVIRLSRRRYERTYLEKIKEMILALRLELSVSKEEILSLYAAHAPFGGNVVGLEAASWRYFARSPDQLTWAESAMLAVLPNSPSLVFPGKSQDRLLYKRNLLLDKLEQFGVIDSLTCSLAKAEPLPSAPHPLPMLAPHLLNRVKLEQKKLPDGSIRMNRQSVARISYAGTSSPYTGPARYQTSLDKNLQIRVTDIVRRHHEQLSGNGIHNAAVLVLDVETKQSLAYVGNIPDLTDSEHGNHVDVVTAPRSTGSILKPLLYAAMIDSGDILPQELVPDIPTRIGNYTPQNFSKTYQGAVPANMALARSMNVPAVRMLHTYGVDRFYALLKDLGMTTLHRPASGYGLTLILGGAEGTLWDITGIYAGLAQNVNRFFEEEAGRRSRYDRPVYLLSDVGDPGIPKGSIFSPAASWITLQAMLEVSRPDEESSWRNFASSRRIAWKTGTSYGMRDGWAVGVTPSHAVGVWVGNADGEGRPELTGLSTAAPMLFEIFGLLDYEGWFEMPESDMVEIEVCARSGNRAGPFCAKTKRQYVPMNGLLARSCPYCCLIQCDATLQWRVHGSCERIGAIHPIHWFVLPPAWEWFYRSGHSNYESLPPYRSDCLEFISSGESASLSLIYPRKNGEIYVPVELDGTRGRTVFKAAHRDPGTAIYWHLDEQFLGTTRGMHQIGLNPEPGYHTLTLVDENGERLEHTFNVLSQNRTE